MPANPDPADNATEAVRAPGMSGGDRVIGFNVQTGRYEDFFEAGIIDPTKLVCNALQIAASVAGLLITTEVAIAPLPGTKVTPPRHYGGEDF
jgi:chaperonin GroEL